MKYQLLPEMSPEQYEALKNDIRDRGVMIPLEYDDNGSLLDGHNRLRACIELGIRDFPKIIRHFDTEEEKRYHVRAINANRRQLTREQMRKIIEDQLKDAPQKSDRQIASGLGVSNKTVSTARKELENNGQLCNLHSSIGADGKERPRQVERKPVEAELLSDEEIKEIAENNPADPIDDIEDIDEEPATRTKILEFRDEPGKPKILSFTDHQKQKADEEEDKFDNGDNALTAINKVIKQINKLNFTDEDIDNLIYYHSDPVFKAMQLIDFTLKDITDAIKILNNIHIKLLQAKGNYNVKKRN